MDIDIIEKHVHLVQLPNGAEVSFGGMPCLTVEGFNDNFTWNVNPFFAKMTYGANIFSDIPYCFEGCSSLEEAIASGLSALDEMGAFRGMVDLPEDSYVEEHLDEVIGEGYIAESKTPLPRAGKSEIDLPKITSYLSAWKTKVKETHGKDITFKQVKATDRYSEGRYEAYHPNGNMVGYFSNKHKTSSVLPALKTEELKPRVARIDKDFNRLVYDSVMNDCRNVALEHSDSIMEAHQLANDLYNSFISELSDKTLRNYLPASDEDQINATKGLTLKDDPKNDALAARAWKRGVGAHRARNALEKHAKEAKEFDKFNIGHKHESVDEAALSGDAYWKAKEKEAALAKTKEQQAKMGIKPPKAGRPTNIDFDSIRDQAKENIKNGLRPTAGMDRNNKRHFIEKWLNHPNHPEFATSHVSKAGRTVGTTNAAKVEKQKAAEQEKKTIQATAGWMSGLGSR